MQGVQAMGEERLTCKRCRKYQKTLKGFIVFIEQYLKALDAEMQKPSTYERGQRIAHLSNMLEIQKDLIKRHEL